RYFWLEFSPALREGQEKSLLSGKSSDYRVGLAFQRQNVGVVRRQQSGKVRNTFTENLFTIDAEIGQRTVLVGLRCQLRACRLIPRKIVGSPPILKPSASVI